MSVKKLSLLVAISLIIISNSCNVSSNYFEDFDQIQDRTWVNEDIWTIPIEDWMVENGKVICTGKRKNMKAVLLKYLLQDQGDFLLTVRMGLDPESNGSGGLRIGLQDETDMDIRSLAYFGNGVNVGVDAEGTLFVGEISKKLPDGFDISDFHLNVDGFYHPENSEIRVEAEDHQGIKTKILSKTDVASFAGAITLISNHPSGKQYTGPTGFWFDDISLSGSAVIEQPENCFGAILWAMYTLSKNTLKMTAQMPPLGIQDNHFIELHFMRDGKWEIQESVKINPDSRNALFKIEDWDDSQDVDYRLRYVEKLKDGSEKEHLYEGTVRKNPKDQPLVFGGLTCQYHYGFPYRPVVENLAKTNPDILYFSGDQLYEGNGGYGIIRFPADSAILNYLGKWYMFGWAFRDVMKDRPTITTPDDHDVFHGNLWGEGGKKIESTTFSKLSGTSGGYVEPKEMVQVVHTTQCSHLPDPYDPTPMAQGISPYYTELLYGNVSFAIVGDRMFKSGPAQIATWEGRKDWIKEKLHDMSSIDKPGLTFLGKRQMNFLRNWVQDWTGAKMKCVLSQTIFANLATHHGGEKTILFADLDSGGWPQTARNEAVKVMRKAFSFHIAGDQHLPTLSQYGIKKFRDAGWAFDTPAITVGYQRRFFPESLGYKITNPPAHGLPNTGEYTDPFGHPMYVYAVGNPEDDTRDPNRYSRARKCASGFGLVVFDTEARTIKVDAIRFDADLSDGIQADDRFPGWPLTIDQLDNYGAPKYGYLPDVELNPEVEYLQVYNNTSGDLVYALRPATKTFKPFVFQNGTYTIRIVNEETGDIRQIKDQKPTR